MNVGAKLAKQIPKHENTDVGDYMNERNLSSMYLLPTTEHEVNSIVKSCKNKMSKDSDDLSMSLLKDVLVIFQVPSLIFAIYHLNVVVFQIK